MSDSDSPMPDPEDPNVDWKAYAIQQRQEKERLLGTRALEEREAVFRDKERHAWQSDKAKGGGGDEGWNPAVVIPKQKLDVLLSALKEADGGKLLIRSPPGSGKTTMAQTFASHCAELGHPVFSLSLARFSSLEHTTADDFFRHYYSPKEIKTTYSCIVERASNQREGLPLILILDETQKWYLGMSPFWDSFKDKPGNILVLFFSAYGDARDSTTTGTPVAIGKSPLSFDFLRLTIEDVQQVAAKMIDASMRGPEALHLYPATLGLLHDLSNGHPEIIRELIRGFVRRSEVSVTKNQQIAYLHSQDCYHALSSLRAFLRLNSMYAALTRDRLTSLLQILLNTNKGYNAVPVPDQSLRGPLLKYGSFYQDDANPDVIHLLCPVAFDILITRHLTGAFSPKDTLESFEEFLIMTTQRLEKKRLRDASAISVAHLDEEFIQKEFYRSACSVLSPVGGSGSGSTYTIQGNAGISPSDDQRRKGKCDFFIDTTLRWGVELLYNGSKIDEHVNRFDPESGRFNSLECKQRAAVDFQITDHFNPPKAPTDLHREVYWGVAISTDFSKVTIYRPPLRQPTGAWISRAPIE